MSVLVYIEPREGKFKKNSFELISFGQHAALAMGTTLHVLVIGKTSREELELTGRYGAQNILVYTEDIPFDDQVYTQIIFSAAQTKGATLVVLPHNFTGRAVAPRLAIRLKAGLVTAVHGLPSNYNPLVVTKRAFSGKSVITQEVTTPIKVLTLSQNTAGVSESPSNVNIEDFKPQISQPSTQILSTDVQSGQVLLTEAEIIVSGGRGMRGPENWKPLEELAKVLGAATACSRPVSD
ncbi:MAG: electron transfer flavoprotein subunit alpha/FixB family protein, partial [Chloroflexota bacterium]